MQPPHGQELCRMDHCTYGPCMGAPTVAVHTQTHRFIESLRLEKTCKIPKSNSNPSHCAHHSGWRSPRPTPTHPPRPSVPHLHNSETPPGMVISPPPWAVCSQILPHLGSLRGQHWLLSLHSFASPGLALPSTGTAPPSVCTAFKTTPPRKVPAAAHLHEQERQRRA